MQRVRVQMSTTGRTPLLGEVHDPGSVRNCSLTSKTNRPTAMISQPGDYEEHDRRTDDEAEQVVQVVDRQADRASRIAQRGLDLGAERAQQGGSRPAPWSRSRCPW